MGLAARQAGLWIGQVLLKPLVKACAPYLFLPAALWRRLLFRTTFIGITGSIGKTTTKELLGAVLAARARTFRTVGNQNGGYQVARNLLRVRPWHRFAVIELGIDKPGAMRRLARMLRPDVAVILAVARVHTKGFANPDDYTAEKAVLLDYLAPGGLAILNGDDPKVAAMADGGRFRVCRVGTSPSMDVWAGQVSSRWPDRLTFQAHSGPECCDIQTQQLGAHWIPSLLAALAAARHLGVGWPQAAAALRSVPPYTARLEPVSLPNGVVFIRDDYSASIDTFEASLRFLREARAGRRVLVVSDVSDTGGNYKSRLRMLGGAVAGWLDLLVLIGHDHKYGGRKAIEAGMSAEKVLGFAAQREAAAWLKTGLKPGDLVLLKGRTTDHMARVFFAQIGSVSCWRDYCRKTMLCDGCWELGFRPESGYTPRSVGRRV